MLEVLREQLLVKRRLPLQEQRRLHALLARLLVVRLVRPGPLLLHVLPRQLNQLLRLRLPVLLPRVVLLLPLLLPAKLPVLKLFNFFN
jgi:hypothetical protein